MPRTDFAAYCDRNNAVLVDRVVNELKPKYWFIENPR